MTHVTTKDIVIPSGTRVRPAAASTRRFTPHGEILIGFDDDTTGSLTFDLGEAVAAGVVVERLPFESN